MSVLVPHGGDARLLNAARKKIVKRIWHNGGPKEQEPHAGARLPICVGGFFITSGSAVLVALVVVLVERQQDELLEG